MTTPLSVDEIMARIKAEASQLELTHPTPCTGGQTPLSPPPLAAPPVPPEPALEVKSSYHLSDLLAFHGEAFIHGAYTAILGRYPDPAGKASYLERLTLGRISRVEVLGRLRYSGEGRRQKTPVKGLARAFALQCLYRIPVLGRLIRIASAIFNLPVILKNIETLNGEVHAHNAQTAALLAAQFKATQAQLEALGTQVTALSSVVDQKASTQMVTRTFAEKKQVSQRLAGLQERVDQKCAGLEANLAKMRETTLKKENGLDIDRLKQALDQIRDLKRNTVDMERRLQLFLETAKSRLPEPFSPDQLREMALEADAIWQAMYSSFEDRFRGTREEIKARVAVYIDDIRQAQEETGNAPVLDVGTGRGEWLEVLKENHIAATGVDLNPIMAEHCRDRGGDVVTADAVTYLRDLPDNSLSAVTGLHIIEHLPQNALMALLGEAFRVIKPGGKVIFETPNPENILVGAHFFYVDPSHNNPLPPSTLSFILEYLGYEKVHIRRLHKYSDYFPVTDSDPFKDRHMYNEMDYAVIGNKA